MQLDDVIPLLRAQLDPFHQVLLQVVVEQVAALRAQNELLREQQAKLSAEVAELRQVLYGARSERGDRVEPVQNEVRRAATAAQVERLARQIAREANRSTPTEADRTTARRRLGRKKSEPERERARQGRSHLPVVHEERLVPDTQLPDGMTRADFVRLGKGETVQRIEFVRAHFVMVNYTLESLKHVETPGLIVQASAPPSPVPGGHYGASVFAAAVVSRCADSMPLHRISSAWRRDGLHIAPSTVGSFLHRAAFLLLDVYNGIHEAVKRSDLIHADETPQPTLAKGKVAKGWMWMACSKAGIVYRYAASRSGEHAHILIGDSTGFLVVDGYSAYSTVVDDTDDTARKRAACWAHGRRLFWKLRKDWPEAQIILGKIRDLYAIEHRAMEKQLSHEGLLLLRRAESKPIT